jgi:hypothetical protein
VVLKEILGASSPSKAAILPWLVIVEIGSSPNLCTLGGRKLRNQSTWSQNWIGCVAQECRPQILILWESKVKQFLKILLLCV